MPHPSLAHVMQRSAWLPLLECERAETKELQLLEGFAEMTSPPKGFFQRERIHAWRLRGKGIKAGSWGEKP